MNYSIQRSQNFQDMRNFNNNNLNEIPVKDQSKDKMHDNLDHRSLIVSNDGHIFFETFGKYYKETIDFLVAIAEPVNRTQNIHEYLLTEYSLYAAASMNIKTEEIIQILGNLSKNVLSDKIIEYIKNNTETYGKVKLILKNNRYFIECNDKTILKKLHEQSEIYNSFNMIKYKRKNGLIKNTINRTTEDFKISLNLNENEKNEINSTNFTSEKTGKNSEKIGNTELQSVIKNIINDGKNVEINEEIDIIGENYFEIDSEDLEKVKKKCIDLKYPLLEEYDFRNDNLPTMNIMPKLKKPARYYQEKALSIMFNNNRARSGIIVLPCGAGKTLIGIMAALTLKRNTIILCNSSVSVEQWHRECTEWSTKIDEDKIIKFTSKNKGKIWDTKKSAGIMITTYTMLAFQGNRSEETAKSLQIIKDTEWGLMILDEVQVVPADMFRKILSVIKSHCKLGLTATLVREDNKIEDLNFLIGPKHYEANWLDLQKEGYLARVRCVEIWCEMNTEFYEEYIKPQTSSRKRQLLYVSNPNKFYICKTLVEQHKNDKIIIFSDNLFCLKIYKDELKIPFISGEVSESEREDYLDRFRRDEYNCIIMSKVGDTSIDLPSANVIIQISSHFGSRRQEAQRLGRILRPKNPDASEFNAYFYTIITKNTEEMYYSTKRQKFLVDQGYCFKVITNLKDIGIENTFEKNKKYCDEYKNKVIEAMKMKDEDIFEEDSISDVEFVDDEIKAKNEDDLSSNSFEEFDEKMDLE